MNDYAASHDCEWKNGGSWARKVDRKLRDYYRCQKPLRTTLQRSGMLIADERKSQPPRMLVGTKDHVRYSEDASYVFSHMIISPEILRRIVGEP